MNEDGLRAEMQHWQARTDDMQVALDRMREDRDLLKAEKETLSEAYAKAVRELAMYKQMVDRMRIAMSQGIEL